MQGIYFLLIIIRLSLLPQNAEDATVINQKEQCPTFPKKVDNDRFVTFVQRISFLQTKQNSVTSSIFPCRYEITSFFNWPKFRFGCTKTNTNCENGPEDRDDMPNSIYETCDFSEREIKRDIWEAINSFRALTFIISFDERVFKKTLSKQYLFIPWWK